MTIILYWQIFFNSRNVSFCIQGVEISTRFLCIWHNFGVCSFLSHLFKQLTRTRAEVLLCPFLMNSATSQTATDSFMFLFSLELTQYPTTALYSVILSQLNGGIRRIKGDQAIPSVFLEIARAV